ncbi:MAG: hypothetical protein M1831_004318 [Alyxoria varia]|nr:MAG: hypothetical protein M1831_004318 [Alyxoria varia]
MDPFHTTSNAPNRLIRLPTTLFPTSSATNGPSHNHQRNPSLKRKRGTSPDEHQELHTSATLPPRLRARIREGLLHPPPKPQKQNNRSPASNDGERRNGEAKGEGGGEATIPALLRTLHAELEREGWLAELQSLVEERVASAAKELERERGEVDGFEKLADDTGASNVNGTESKDFAGGRGGRGGVRTTPARAKEESANAVNGSVDRGQKLTENYSASVMGVTGVNLVDEEEELAIPDVEDIMKRVKVAVRCNRSGANGTGRAAGRNEDAGQEATEKEEEKDTTLHVPDTAVDKGIAVLREGLDRICEVADDGW